MGVWDSEELYLSLIEIITGDEILTRRILSLLQNTEFNGLEIEELPAEALRKAYIMATTNVAVFEDAKVEAMINTTISRRNDDYYMIRTLRPIVEKYKKIERRKKLGNQ